MEQKAPYDFNYPGSISGKGLKEAFLTVYDATEKQNATDLLAIIFQKMVIKRDKSIIKMSSPVNLTVKETFELMKKHFSYDYKNVSGAARLPSLAIYSAYKSIVGASYGRYS